MENRSCLECNLSELNLGLQDLQRVDLSGANLSDSYMVNVDLTRQHINQHKDEVQKGGKVTILRKGYVVTNSLSCQTAAVAGEHAFVQFDGTIANSGCVGDDNGNSGSSIGRFLSSVDEDGYAKVYIDLPNTNA